MKIKPMQKKEFLKHLYKTVPSIKDAIKLILEFCRLIQKRKRRLFADWLTRAKDSEMVNIVNFANRIGSTYEAVKNACTIEWSTGQVEGQVN